MLLFLWLCFVLPAKFLISVSVFVVLVFLAIFDLAGLGKDAPTQQTISELPFDFVSKRVPVRNLSYMKISFIPF